MPRRHGSCYLLSVGTRGGNIKHQCDKHLVTVTGSSEMSLFDGKRGAYDRGDTHRHTMRVICARR